MGGTSRENSWAMLKVVGAHARLEKSNYKIARDTRVSMLREKMKPLEFTVSDL